MTFDAMKKDLTVAVVGTGTMGRGIMQVSAQGGMRVIAFDQEAGAAAKAREAIAKTLRGLVEKGRISDSESRAAVERISVADQFKEVKQADIVIEAVVEILDVKQALFQRLDELCGPETILASNTSSLSVTAIAARCGKPERVGGMHYFNPVPLMKLVEIIPGLKTAQWVTDAMMGIGRRQGREPVLCIDSPGFIVNHAGRGIREVERVLIEGIAQPHEIDRIMTGAPGLKLGPFALFDMVGLDISHGVHVSFFEQYFGEPAYQPSPIGTLRIAGGMLGAKTGRGWYHHADGKRIEPALTEAPKVALPTAVWIAPEPGCADLQEPVRQLCVEAGVALEGGERPSEGALILVTPLGEDVTTVATKRGFDAGRTVGLDTLFGMKGPRTLMVSPSTRAQVREAAHALLAYDGQPVVVNNDSPGFVAQRTIAMIVNIGCQIAQRGIAQSKDIDKAVKLGLGYPYGPLEWGDRIGPGRVLTILERLQTFYGEPRYRPSPWLKRRVALGLPLTAPDRMTAV